MRKTLKYLLITCVVLGAPAYAADEGKGRGSSAERVLDLSRVTRHLLTVEWFGKKEECARLSDVQAALEPQEQAIRQQRAQAQRELETANAARDALQRDAGLALRTQEERTAQALEVQIRESSSVLEEFRRRAEEERQIMLASLRNQQRLLDVQQREQDALLVAKEGAEGDAMRQRLRVEKLEQTVHEKDALIEPLKRLESKLRDLIEEKERLTAQLEDALGKAEKDADLIGRLQAGVEETRTKEQRLRQEIEHLQKEQAEKEALIARYQQAQRAGDYYTHLLDLINDKGCLDDELARQIYATIVRSGKQLGQFHPDGQPSLVVALMKVTRPYKETYTQAGVEPGSARDQYKSCFRELGNQLQALGFDDPLDLEKVRF